MKERSQTPFKEEFKDRALGAGGFATVREFENDPRWVVKEIRIGNLEQNIAEAKKGIEAVEKFLPEFVPKNHLVVGKGQRNRARLFIAQERIHGKDMYDMLYMTLPKVRDPKLEELEPALDDFFSGVVEMYLGTFNTEKRVGLVPDIGISNLMVGRKAGETEDKLYLVDLYPVAVVEPDNVSGFLTEKADTIKGSHPFETPKFDAALKKLEKLVVEQESVKK